MSYASEVLADSPYGYWELDESGFPMADSSGSGYTILSPGTGTFTIGSATSPPQGGTSVNYANGDTGVDVSAFAGRPYTLEGWFYPTTNDGGAFINRGNDGGADGVGIGIGSGTMDSDGLEVIGIVNNIAWKPSGYTLPALNAWYHIVMTDDGTDIRFYVNGTLQATVSSTAPNLSSMEMHIGRENLSGRSIRGNVAHVAVYNSALSGSRVTAHYNAASGLSAETGTRTVNGVAAYLKVYAGTGTRLVTGVDAVIDLPHVDAETGTRTVTGVNVSINVPTPWPGTGTGTARTHLDYNRTYVLIGTTTVPTRVLKSPSGTVTARLLDLDLDPIDLTDRTVTFDIALNGINAASTSCTIVTAATGDVSFTFPTIAAGTYIARFTVHNGDDTYSYPVHGLEVKV